MKGLAGCRGALVGGFPAMRSLAEAARADEAAKGNGQSSKEEDRRVRHRDGDDPWGAASAWG